MFIIQIHATNLKIKVCSPLQFDDNRIQELQELMGLIGINIDGKTTTRVQVPKYGDAPLMNTKTLLRKFILKIYFLKIYFSLK